MLRHILLRLIPIGANIAKVESRGKIYFHYAETKHIYEP